MTKIEADRRVIQALFLSCSKPQLWHYCDWIERPISISLNHWEKTANKSDVIPY